ncbi:MAG: LPS export ABC transporter periplasmic protein LptC [Endomicrobium sp.]|nr:LPS export ABC transporter periplasmic protein LptC [Endomicrobium sp.]
MLRLIAIFIVFFFMGCRNNKNTSDETPSISEEQTIERFRITKTQKGELEMILEADFAFINESRNIAHLRFPVVKFYDCGKYISTFIAESADIDMEVYDVKGYGNCTVISVNYGNLETKNLIYNAKKKKIYTNSDVKIVRQRERIYGTSLESDIKLEKIVIKNQRIIFV